MSEVMGPLQMGGVTSQQIMSLSAYVKLSSHYSLRHAQCTRTVHVQLQGIISVIQEKHDF